jgi:acetylglutamate kinase
MKKAAMMEDVLKHMSARVDITNEQRANVLIQALPYIQKWAGKTVVVKYGGNAMLNEELKEAVMSDIVLLQLVGINVVLVHGGGPEINAMLDKIGKESKFVGGMRYTDEETMDVVQMVLAGKVNKSLVQHLMRHSGKALGLCGLDGRMLMAEKLMKQDDLGFVGEIVEVNTGVIEDAIDKGYTPVVSTIAGGYGGEVYNINADTAAAEIAAKLKASKLILMTDICGLLRDKDDESTLIPVVNVSEVPLLKKQGVISGGMIPKIDCCVEAVRQGVGRAHIIDGRIPHSILIEMFTDSGIGTMFY